MNIPQFKIKFNPEFCRYEVFSSNSVIRNGKEQPVFVAPTYVDCVNYINEVRCAE